jgi:glycosyltransferase involved in cell wall biosynthesis
MEDVTVPPTSLCLVTEDLPGTSAWRVAHVLARSGWKVHVLYCGQAGHARRPGEASITFSSLNDYQVPPVLALPSINHPLTLRSEHVRYALEGLDRRHRFDLVAFPDTGALGFRTVQARRTGLAFAGLRMLITIHGPGQRLREQNHQYLHHSDDLELDFAERYAFEHADFQAGTSLDLLEYARRIGWHVRDNARVTSNTIAEPHQEGLLPALYQELARQPRPASGPSPASATKRPLVTVVVPYFNLGAHLPETLSSLAAQTYPNLEVLVINDGSTDPDSVRVFQEQERRYPRFRFLSQENAGIGATRNRGLCEARGAYFLPVDADNVPFLHMVETLVGALERNPGLAAMTCFYLAFRDSAALARGQYLYAGRPAGGPQVMASFRNVYGDASALFRTDAFRAVGGYETDRDTSWEDWEAFLKLVNAGFAVGVVPEYLFAYRHLEGGFSRVTRRFQNHQRVLRQVYRMGELPRAEMITLWTALVGLQRRFDELTQDNHDLRLRAGALPHRLVDLLGTVLGKVPLLSAGVCRLARSGRRAWHFLRGQRTKKRTEIIADGMNPSFPSPI